MIVDLNCAERLKSRQDAVNALAGKFSRQCLDRHFSTMLTECVQNFSAHLVLKARFCFEYDSSLALATRVWWQHGADHLAKGRQIVLGRPFGELEEMTIEERFVIEQIDDRLCLR